MVLVIICIISITLTVNRTNLIALLYFKKSNQILHSDKHHRILNVGRPKICTKIQNVGRHEMLVELADDVSKCGAGRYAVKLSAGGPGQPGQQYTAAVGSGTWHIAT